MLRWAQDRMRRFAPHPIPFHHQLETTLLRFGRRDRWTIGDSVEATLVLGGVGSGKTSGAGNSLMRAMLYAGYGGLVLCAKNNEADRVCRLASECGRGRSVIRFDASGVHRFNFMEYTAATLGRDGFDQNLSAALLAAAEASRTVKSTGGDGDNAFFREASEELLLHVLPFLRVTQPQLRLRDLMRFIDTAPQTSVQSKNKTWVKTSFCAQVLLQCRVLADQGHHEAARIAEEHADYWLLRFPQMGDRTRGSIVATLTSTIAGLLSGKINELLGTDTTVVPELTHEGAILVLDLSIHEFGAVGAIAQQIIKTLWMKSIQYRKPDPKRRPLFLWIDEYQLLASAGDADFLSTSREYRTAPVFITQDLPTLYAAFGGEENRGKQLVAKFGTRIFHATTDPVTAGFASDVIGQTRKQKINRSVNQGRNSGASGNQGGSDASSGSGDGETVGQGIAIEGYDDQDIRPEYFGNELRTGGKANRRRVDAIVIRSGARFKKSRRNRLKVTFHQNAR